MSLKYRKALIIIFALTFFLFFLNQEIICQVPPYERPVIEAVKIDKPLELNGKLDNPIWNLAKPVELNYETDPGNNIPSEQKAFVYTLYNNHQIYFGIRCLDTNPDQIRANITDRDKMYNDDMIAISLDLFGDYQRTYTLCVNPLGIKGDMLNGNTDFDMIWDATATKNQNGWTAEIAIPFSSFNFPNKEEQEWLITIERKSPRSTTKTFSWTMWDKNIPNSMVQAGIIKGIKNISSGGTFELLPYTMGQMSGYLSTKSLPTSGIKYDPVVGRVGVGINYSPSSDFKLEAVINPDFSQIESDAAQISVNTTFALQYAEKRPFFLSGMEILSNLWYYTRLINDPSIAVKASGKSGNFAFVYQGAYDRNTIFIVPGEERSNTVTTSLKSISNIGRLIYDLGDESSIGASLLTKDLDSGHNYVFEFDGTYKFWQNWFLFGRFYFTHTKELDESALFGSTRKFGNTNYTAGFNGEEYWGDRVSLEIRHFERNYNLRILYAENSPTVQMYNAYVTSTGLRNFLVTNNFTFYPQNTFIDRATIGATLTTFYNYDDIRKIFRIQPTVSLTMKGQTNLSVIYNAVNQEKYLGKEFSDINNIIVDLFSNPIKELSFGMNLQFGNFIYRTANPTIGNGHNLTSTIQLKPNSQLDISFSYSRAKLRSNNTQQLFYDGNIYRTTAIYNFSSQLFFRTILQYDSFASSFQLYPLVSYKLNAFTTFYLGATSNYLDYGGEFGLRNTDQQYFVKMQYLLGI